MATLFQTSDDELERLQEELTHRQSNETGSDALVVLAARIVETERRSGVGPAAAGAKADSSLIEVARGMVAEEVAKRVDDRRLAAVLHQKLVDEHTKPPKKSASIVSPLHVWTWVGDAKVWMEMAVALDRDSRGTGSDIQDHNKANVAHVATGFAFELVYKCLLVAEFEPFLQSHSCRCLHERLPCDTQEILEAIMIENGWPECDAVRDLSG